MNDKYKEPTPIHRLSVWTINFNNNYALNVPSLAIAALNVDWKNHHYYYFWQKKNQSRLLFIINFCIKFKLFKIQETKYIGFFAVHHFEF